MKHLYWVDIIYILREKGKLIFTIMQISLDILIMGFENF